MRLFENTFRAGILFVLFVVSVLFIAPQSAVHANSLSSVVDAQSVKSALSQHLKRATIDEKEVGKSFSLKFEMMIPQPINHFQSSSDGETAMGEFFQRVFLFHKSFDKPVIFVTEGYDASYAESSRYKHELCDLLDANLIVVEHRFYGKSIPEELAWKFLNIKQAAADHHQIAQTLRELYTNKWISTGTSKGGSTAIYHKALYPNDVDAVVAYVAPITIAQEDPRPIEFVLNNSHKKERKAVEDFQKRILKDKTEAIKYLENFKEKHKVKFIMPIEAVVEYTVFEYAYSFWQWGMSPNRITNKKSKMEQLVNHLFMIVTPTTFVDDRSTSSATYYYQAYSETGYYSFNEMAKKFSKFKLSQNDYGNRIMADMNLEIKYDPNTHIEILEKLNSATENIIQIHGSIDPWRYAAWEPPVNSNCLFFEAEGIAHGANYKNLSVEQKKSFKDAIKLFTAIEVKY